MHAEHGVSIRRGCAAVGLARSTYRYQRTPRPDKPVIEVLAALVERHPSIGFWQAFHRLRLAGHAWNHKRVYRIYTAMRLNTRRRARKRLPARVKQALVVPEEANQVWSIDFTAAGGGGHNRLWDGRAFRLLNVIDDFNSAAYRRRSRCSGSKSTRRYRRSAWSGCWSVSKRAVGCLP